MLIGAHVSPAGGPANAVARGVERGCRAIQIFNQSPRQWKPTVYDDEKVAAFKEAMDGLGRRGAADPRRLPGQLRLRGPGAAREVADLADRLAARRGGARGRRRGACIPGRRSRTSLARRSSGPPKSIKEALAESEGCDLHLENTAGAGGTLGRTFEELAALIEGAGGAQAAARLPGLLPPAGQRLRHPDRRRAERRGRRVRPRRRARPARLAARQRLEDARSAPTSTATRALGEGELGVEGCAAFLSEPRFDGLACVFEGPGMEGKGVEPVDMAIAWRMRAEGLRARG